MDECRPLRSLRVCPLTSVTSNAGSGNMLSTPTIDLVFDSWRFYDELRVRGSQNLRWWQVVAVFPTTCRTTSSCLASIRPLRTTDFSFGGRIGHMESFMRLHTSVVRTSKEAESPAQKMFTEYRILIKPSSGRPDTLPTTRFHVPASIVAPSIFSECHQVCLIMVYNLFDRSTYVQIFINPPAILLSDPLVQVVI